MLTYLKIRKAIHSFDEEELSWYFGDIVFSLLFDIIFMVFQPIFILVYILWKKVRKW